MKDFEKVRTPLQVITDGDMSSQIISVPRIPIRFLHNIGIQLVFTGTPTGTFYVDGSINGTTWEPLVTDPDPISASGAAGDHLISLNQVPYDLLRIRYEATSGSGVLNAWWMAKGLRI